MAGRVRVVAAAAGGALILGSMTAAGAATAAAQGQQHCSAGAHTLAPPGSHLYPDTGNGGYTSLHTDVDLVYDATSNQFLAGNHVVLTDRATQCLTSFSLDFERRSANKTAGPDMKVTSITVNGQPAKFTFVQPTYPGDPHGQNDPDPRAHEASQVNPVGGPQHNPLPPACSPELLSTNPAKKESLNGTQCPANKLVITPAQATQGRQRVPGHGGLHRPSRRAQRRGRHHRGLVPVEPAQGRRRVRHHRAGRHRGLDAAQRLPERQADVRRQRHR